MENFVIFIVGFVCGCIVGFILAAISVVSGNAGTYYNDPDDGDDNISRKGLVEYLNLDNYDDTDLIKVKYIRQFLDRN